VRQFSSWISRLIGHRAKASLLFDEILLIGKVKTLVGLGIEIGMKPLKEYINRCILQNVSFLTEIEQTLSAVWLCIQLMNNWLYMYFEALA
jgi:hypothetical protein